MKKNICYQPPCIWFVCQEEEERRSVGGGGVGSLADVVTGVSARE